MENNTYNQSTNEEGNAWQQGQSPQNYGEQGNYQLDLEPPVSMGEWLISLLLLLVPCVNIVLMFVWAFSKSEKKSKSNFFKAQLIFAAVIFVLWIILFVVFGSAVMSAMY